MSVGGKQEGKIAIAGGEGLRKTRDKRVTFYYKKILGGKTKAKQTSI